MRSVLHNLLVAAIALAWFVATSHLFGQFSKIQPPDRSSIEVQLEPEKKALLEATERALKRYLRPGAVPTIVIPPSLVPPQPNLVPPPPNHESNRRVKTIS